MGLSYFDFPFPPQAESRPSTAGPQNLPILFGDDLFDIDDMPELDQADMDFLLQLSDATPPPRPPPKHTGRAQRDSYASTRNSIIACRTRRALSVSSARSGARAGFAFDDLPLLSPVPSLSYQDYSSCGSSIMSDEVTTPPLGDLMWTTEEKNFMIFTGSMTQRSRATSKSSSRTPSLSYPAKDLQSQLAEAPPLPGKLDAFCDEDYITPTPSPLRVSRPISTAHPSRATSMRSTSSRLVDAQSITSSLDSDFRVDAVIVRPRAQTYPPRRLRRSPAIPTNCSLRQLRAEQSEACLKAVYERQLDAYLDGTIALNAFGL